MTTIDRFAEIAAGATELSVRLKKGDLTLRSGEGVDWSFAYSSGGDEVPQVSRAGARLVIEQPENYFHQRRMDVEITAPRQVERFELQTGHGRCQVEGAVGRIRLSSGHGGVTLRDGSGQAEISTGHGELIIESFTGPLEANTGHGHVTIQGLQGDGELRTGHGRMELRRNEGRLRISSGHGEIQIEETGGQVELKSGHGGVEVSRPRGLVLHSQTGMGGVRIDGGSLRGLVVKTGKGEVAGTARLEPGNYDVNTGMGNISLELPDGLAMRVDLQTGFGGIQSDLPLVQVGRSGPMGFGGMRMVGSVGEGDPQIELNLRTGKGNIALYRAGAAPMTSVRSSPWWRTTVDDPSAIGQATADAIEAAARAAAETAGPIAARAAESAAWAAEVAARHVEAAAQEIAREVESAVGEAFGGPSARRGPASGEPTPAPPGAPMPPPPGAPPGAHPPPPAPIAAMPATADPAEPTGPAASSEPERRPAAAGGESPGGDARPDRPLPPNEDPTLRILEALARGEISVDEAQGLLNQRR
ncbi:MAG TPA: hypothetical protein VG370_32045 [Chloroflexota bacterium]|jgi:DUF4097 and DUF4098 domain-containing protein YvlB|nr:hypothetical protein [Chloroflexota bacterium]